MDISQVYLNFKDLFRKARLCKHFLLVIFSNLCSGKVPFISFENRNDKKG